MTPAQWMVYLTDEEADKKPGTVTAKSMAEALKAQEKIRNRNKVIA